MRELITLLEDTKKLELAPLPYARDALSPVMSKATLDYHYGELTRGYVDRFNSGEGDADFNEAGAYLHTIYWGQFKPPASGANRPIGPAAELIDRHFGDYQKFREEFKTTAMAIQGSGWAYLSKSGQIKTIKNHAIRQDALLVVDMWEHSWALDYQADKGKYIDNIWRCMDWDRVNHRF